jgi:hypothetical protein
MAKLTNVEISALLQAKGLTVPADNPNLMTIAQSLGVLPKIHHEAKFIAWDSKGKSEVPVGTKDAKVYLAVSGGARGRDCWFPVNDRKLADVASELITALSELAKS